MIGDRGRLLRGLKSGENLLLEKPSLVIRPSRRGPSGSELRLDVGVIRRLSPSPACPLLSASRGACSRIVCGGCGFDGDGRLISLFSETLGTANSVSRQVN